ncbi:MAG: biopolymer transporter ExbD [Chromatiaceae bacterium]|nr:biopolymer transporter ExbD [Chromatiaceae bacterium]MCF7994688.1 biopolymer transporter ExbD [Chromatiaceae bacterium]MCF8015200.1 biopolymer transporter ExbD [Chromatiaceae bacterium]
MNLRPHRPEVPEINLTPLIDVVFLLLIFFMVTTSFRDEGRLRLQLPEADAEPVPAEEIELVEVMVDRAGRFYVNAQMVNGTDLETLKQALIGAVGAERELPVLIKADAKAEHQAVMQVLDAAGQLGLSQVAFAASQSPRQTMSSASSAVSGLASKQPLDQASEQASDQMSDQGPAEQRPVEQEPAEQPSAVQESDR